MSKKRIILKLSGEALAGNNKVGIDPETVQNIAVEIKKAYDLGNVELGIIVGGGNIWRGVTAAGLGMERSSADYMGMLATVMNALALQNALETLGVDTRTLTSIQMQSVAEPYIRRRAIRHLEKGRIVIFGGGTGNPYFSTDTTTALRGAEINVDTIYVAKNGVDGVYDKDPNVYENAVKYNKISHRDVIEQKLQVMDLTSITLCMENNIDIKVFEMSKKDNIKKAVSEANFGTLITNK